MERSIKGTLVGTHWRRRFKRKILARSRRAEVQTVNIFSIENSALEQVLTRSPDPASYKESKIIKSERKIMVVRFPLEVGGTIKSVYMKQHNALSLGHRIASLCRYPSAAMRSLSGAVTLLEKGYATAAPLAAVEYRRCGVLVKSLYVSEEISGAKSVETFWRDNLCALKGLAGYRARRLFLRSLAELFRSLHGNGIYHNDLKSSNILVSDGAGLNGPSFSLIDLQGLGQCVLVSTRRRIKNLAQLNRTLGVHLTWTEKLFFFKSYGDRQFHSRRKKRAFVQRILDQTNRQIIRESQRRATAEPCSSVEVLPKKPKTEERQPLTPFLLRLAGARFVVCISALAQAMIFGGHRIVDEAEIRLYRLILRFTKELFMRLKRSAQWSACFLMLLGAAGCTTYYRVTDQPSRKVYYTTDIDRTESGAVQFHDDKTGARVTLQSSEIVEISKGTYRDGIRQ